jgi:hypothetical protein
MLAVLLALAAAAGYGGSDYAAGLAARRAALPRPGAATSPARPAATRPVSGSAWPRAPGSGCSSSG